MNGSSVQDAVMIRKDCEHNPLSGMQNHLGPPRSPSKARTWIGTALVVVACATAVRAGSVRLWPFAVVVGDTIRLDDLCELRGFTPDIERALAKLVTAEAPPPGGSRVIHFDLLRKALTAGGANLADITFRGATQCAVSRPSNAVPTPVAPDPVRTASASDRAAASSSRLPYPAGDARSDAVQAMKRGSHRLKTGAPSTGGPDPARRDTLRNAVQSFLNKELRRYGGRADLVFDRTSEQVLDLAGSTYTFNVHRRPGPPLGLVPLEVDVLVDGRTIQTVPLVVQVSMLRSVVVTARAINQEAAIQASDLHLVPFTFTRMDKLGVTVPAEVIGKRAKRFIPAGSLIEPSMLETVPLVRRGQFVTLTSVAGAVRVVTAAKAVGTGALGDAVKVRAVDHRRVEFEGIVVGPSRVQIGAPESFVTRFDTTAGGGS